MRLLGPIALLLVLIIAVSGSIATGTLAGFTDSENSEENYMCAGTVNLEFCGEPFNIGNMVPEKVYTLEKLVINAGTLDSFASVHIKDLLCLEDVPGPGVATSEPELVAEEGGELGQKEIIGGLGTDICNIADHILVRLLYDDDDDGNFDTVAQGSLSDIACNIYPLGIIPGAGTLNNNTFQGGGWGSYFAYNTVDPGMSLPLVMGQNSLAGFVAVWVENGILVVQIDTTSSGWEMAATHLYVDPAPPGKLAPGSFPYSHMPPATPTLDTYEIPLIWGGQLYMAVHAEGYDNETAWAAGTIRHFRMEVIFPDIHESQFGLDYFDGDDELEAIWEYWPTNAYQGDKATFNVEFILNGLSTKHKHKK